MSKTLVAYFSCTSTTEDAAKRISAAAGADLYKIEPKVPYTQADLDWNNRDSRTSVEMRDFSCRPEIVGGVHNMQSYDVVFVGFPIWWYNAPSIIKTFLESYDFGGKKLVCFATTGGGDLKKAEAVLAALVKNATWLPGKIVTGDLSEPDLKAWVESVTL